MSTLAEAADLCAIPDGAVPEFGVTVVAYMNEDGEGMYGIATHGDSSWSGMVGILNMAAHDIMHGVTEDGFD